METKRREVTYEQVLEEAFFIEDVLKNVDSPERRINSSLMEARSGLFGAFLDSSTYLWYTKIRPKAFYLLALASIILSVTLVLGEMIILFQLNFSLFDLIPQSTIWGKLFANLFSLVLLAYLSLCVYYGLFNIKFTSFYELHANQQTDSFSLLYSANFLTKLAAPLCFNFLKIIHME